MRLVASLVRIAFALVVLLAMAAAPARADDYADSAAIDELFAQLSHATSAGDANEIAGEIWAYWLAPSVPDLARRMDKASADVKSGDLEGGLALYGEIVRDYPDYAEGWNQHATVLYMLGRYDGSLADIDHVLAIEPRHFGARSGRVLILLKQGRRAEALREMVAALAIHPYLSEKALFPELAPNVTHV